MANITGETEVKGFLGDFHVKLNIWGLVVRDDRGKNSQTLLDLEITKDYRKKVLEDLKIKDYSEGPIIEKLNGGSDMWVFGSLIKTREIYIKISMGFFGAQVICLSFHIAEHAMRYPFRS